MLAARRHAAAASLFDVRDSRPLDLIPATVLSGRSTVDMCGRPLEPTSGGVSSQSAYERKLLLVMTCCCRLVVRNLDELVYPTT